MADFDPNIPLKGVVQQPSLAANPLQFMTGVAQLNAMGNQNKLFQQEYAAREALGPIFQKAVTPDGDIDTAAAMKGIAQSPQAAWKAPEVLQSLVSKQLTQAQVTKEDIMNARTWNQNFATNLTGTLANPTFQSKDLQDVVAGSIAQIRDPEARKRFTAMAAKTLADLPPQPQLGSAPEAWDSWRTQVRNLAKPVLANTQTTQQGFDAVAGVMGWLDTGDASMAVKRDPLAGTVSDAKGEAAFMPKALSPGERVQTHPVVTKDAQGRDAPGIATSAQIDAELNGRGGVTTRDGQTQGAGPGLRPIQSSLSPAEATSQQNQESTAHEYRVEYQGAVDSLLPIVKRLNAMEGAAAQFEAGGGTMLRQQVAQLVQSVPGLSREAASKLTDQIMRSGTNPDGTLKDGLAASQIFMIHAAPEAIQALKQAAQGTGRVMKSEVDTFLSSIDINKDPSAIQQYINFTRDLGKTYVDKLDKLRQFEQGIKAGDPKFQGYSKQDFPSWYATNTMSGMLEPGNKVLKNREPAAKTTPKRSLGEIFGGR